MPCWWCLALCAWHCDPTACAQDPVQASPGITPWEQECRAAAPRITGSLSRAGLGPASKPPSEQGSQAAQPQLTPAHSTAALRIVLPSAALQGAVPAAWVWGAIVAEPCSACLGPHYLHFPDATSTHGFFPVSPAARRHCHQPQLSQQTSAQCFLLQLPWELCQAWLPLRQSQPRSGTRVRAAEPHFMGHPHRCGTALPHAHTAPRQSIAPVSTKEPRPCTTSTVGSQTHHVPGSHCSAETPIPCALSPRALGSANVLTRPRVLSPVRW